MTASKRCYRYLLDARSVGGEAVLYWGWLYRVILEIAAPDLGDLAESTKESDELLRLALPPDGRYRTRCRPGYGSCYPPPASRCRTSL
jgi:hypothetical protein